jgi:hypothetical protein
MSSATAREVLIVEVIGDVAKLIDRVEALTPAMNASQKKLADAAARLGGGIEPLRARMVQVITQTENAAVEHVRRCTAEIAAESMRKQRQAMEDAARAIVEKEIGPPLRQLASTLQTLVERTRRPQWETWATYAATGTLPTILATCFTVYLMRK